VTSRARRQLLRRLWADKARENVSALARAAGVSFAAAHRELEAMRAAGLTVAERHGVATVYRANLAHPQADVLTALLAAAPPVHVGADEQERRGQLAALGAPLGGPAPKRRRLPAEEVLAEGLVLAHRLPLVGIPTLEIVARPHTYQQLPIWAILQAGRERVCAAHYVRRRGRWIQQAPYYLTTWEKLCAEVEKPALLCGEIDAHDADSIREQLGPDVTIATPAASVRRAAYLAELGWERLAQNESDNPATLSPIYLQQPPIDG